MRKTIATLILLVLLVAVVPMSALAGSRYCLYVTKLKIGAHVATERNSLLLYMERVVTLQTATGTLCTIITARNVQLALTNGD